MSKGLPPPLPLIAMICCSPADSLAMGDGVEVVEVLWLWVWLPPIGVLTTLVLTAVSVVWAENEEVVVVSEDDIEDIENIEVLVTVGVDFVVGVVDVIARVVDCFVDVLLWSASFSGHSFEVNSPRKTNASSVVLSALTPLQAALIWSVIWSRPLIHALEHVDPVAKSLALQLGICLL
jgi:hypothetical protein